MNTTTKSQKDQKVPQKVYDIKFHSLTRLEKLTRVGDHTITLH